MGIRSPLYERHKALGAKIVPFGGWDMPLSYGGVLEEHRSVREAAAVFDVSHLGKIIVRGSQALSTLDSLLPGKVAALPVGRAGYNLVLDENGGIVDDIFVYRVSEDELLIVPNASNFEAVFSFLSASASGRDVQVEDARMRWAILALSGPAAPQISQKISSETESLKLHRFTNVNWDGVQMLVAKTGYTGEYTLEYFPPWDSAELMWDALVDLGAKPAGLGARDTLRLEMGYPLHGNDISVNTNPLEAGLEWLIDWEKEFIGKATLLSVKDRGPARRLVGLRAQGKGIPRPHQMVSKDGSPVGEITSGNISVTLGIGIALAYVAPDAAEPGTMLEVDVRGRVLPMQVVRPPFIDS